MRMWSRSERTSGSTSGSTGGSTSGSTSGSTGCARGAVREAAAVAEPGQGRDGVALCVVGVGRAVVLGGTRHEEEQEEGALPSQRQQQPVAQAHWRRQRCCRTPT